MTLNQAASASADALTIASTFLFVAYTLRLAFDNHDRLLANRDRVLLELCFFFRRSVNSIHGLCCCCC